jgi:hypothetical protein
MPFMIMESLSGIFCGIITHQFSAYRELIWAGCLLMTLGTGLYIVLGATSSLGMILGVEIIAGIGCGLLFQPVTVAIQVFTKQKDVATATSTLGFVRTMAVSFRNIAVLGSILMLTSCRLL